MSVAVPAESAKEMSEFDLDVRVELDEPTAAHSASTGTPAASILWCTVAAPAC
ncbi:FDLD family class I lanthipeptide [Streptomyces sp. NEAU-YJ-81]|uniref:FDLD family class I lanthipeptide n=1 Tax=Streptomyces sp. NEAU-YJ-81 TaxID=2820288 RepID=UPI001ABD3E46|nr:FDLD family class I lanthipeptide [Streptomyces sp. NEAU-YJ-81]MBO3680051.1 FDLD family class I lanthipeptide [Streptomyces sp. NEAU-YJ-81]